MVTPDTKRIARAISIMAVLGWIADASCRVQLHQGWNAALAALNAVTSVVLAIVLHQDLKRA